MDPYSWRDIRHSRAFNPPNYQLQFHIFLRSVQIYHADYLGNRSSYLCTYSCHLILINGPHCLHNSKVKFQFLGRQLTASAFSCDSNVTKFAKNGNLLSPPKSQYHTALRFTPPHTVHKNSSNDKNNILLVQTPALRHPLFDGGWKKLESIQLDAGW